MEPSSNKGEYTYGVHLPPFGGSPIAPALMIEPRAVPDVNDKHACLRCRPCMDCSLGLDHTRSRMRFSRSKSQYVHVGMYKCASTDRLCIHIYIYIDITCKYTCGHTAYVYTNKTMYIHTYVHTYLRPYVRTSVRAYVRAYIQR